MYVCVLVIVACGCVRVASLWQHGDGVASLMQPVKICTGWENIVFIPRVRLPSDGSCIFFELVYFFSSTLFQVFFFLLRVRFPG